MMVTGDYHHTAIAVARGVGIIPQAGPMIIIQARSEMSSLPPSCSQSDIATEAQTQESILDASFPGHYSPSRLSTDSRSGFISHAASGQLPFQAALGLMTSSGERQV